MFAWWLILVLVGVNAVGLIASLWFVYHYCHPDDLRYNQGVLAQVVAVAGFQVFYLAFGLVCTDAYSTYFEGGFNMSYCWKLVYLAIVLYLTVVLPLAVFYYEAESDPRITKTAPWLQCVKRGALVITIVWVLLGLLYLACRKIKVPVEKCVSKDCQVVTTVEVEQSLDFLSYLVGIPGWLGWLILIFAGGIGTAYLPIVLFLKWWHTPKALEQHEYERMKKVLGERAKALRTIGEGLAAKESARRGGGLGKKSHWGNPAKRFQFKSTVSKYKEVSQLLTEEYERLEARKHGILNPLKYTCYFLLAMLSVALTLVLWCQVLMAVIYPSASGKDPLNGISAAFIAVRKSRLFLPEFILYLAIYGHQVVCSIVGSMKLNAKFSSCLPVEPLRPRATHLNSMLFHIAMMMISGCAVIELSVKSLPSYLEGSEGQNIVYMESNYVKLFKFFYRKSVFEWVWFVLSLIAAIWLSIWPSEKPPLDLDDPKVMAHWAKLNATLGVDNAGPGGVTPPPADETPLQPEEPAGHFTRLKDKMNRLDKGVENAPGTLLGAAVKKPWE